MNARRTNPRRRRLHRRDSRADRDVDVAPARIALFDRLENRRRHREYARISAGDQGDMASILDQAQRMARALHFDPIAGLVPRLPLFGRKPFEIGCVANKIGCIRDEVRGFGRDPRVATGAKADNPQSPRRSHGRLPWPGMRMEEK